MLVVGLTGGIGSGKSTVSAFFETQGIEVIDADIIARDVVAKGSECLKEIVEHFGELALLDSGELDRAYLRKKIFDAPEEREWLEQLTHPLIRQRILDSLHQASGPYCILASPLLIETAQTELVDRIAVVDIPTELQLARASTRDISTTKHIQKIIDAQLSREKRLEMADDVIDNARSKSETEQQLVLLHQKYIALALHDEY